MTSLEKLAQLGVPFEPGGMELVRTVVWVLDVGQLMWLLDLGLDEDSQRAYVDALLGPATLPEADLTARLVAASVGQVPISVELEAEAAPLFPLPVAVTTAASPITVSNRVDLGADEGLSVVVFTDVNMEAGGWFHCAGTMLVFACEKLHRLEPSTAGHDFSIVGLPGSTPAKPAEPTTLGQAPGGVRGQCSANGIALSGGKDGLPGAPGRPGIGGGPGGDGTPSQPAAICIGAALDAAEIVVSTRSGDGGTGGSGGDGGLGQRGGNGGDGVTCGWSGSAGGNGGRGGDGGAGGRGGDGGDGADANGGIVVLVPSPGDLAKVRAKMEHAPPGMGGHAGTGGEGGAGGAGGSRGRGSHAGRTGEQGRPGAYGEPGISGQRSGQPATVVPLLDSRR